LSAGELLGTTPATVAAPPGHPLVPRRPGAPEVIMHPSSQHVVRQPPACALIE